jgi:hypothetical protein
MNVIPEAKLKCPIAMKWTIPEWELKQLNDGLVDTVFSETFYTSNISGIQYYLFLENSEDAARIYLNLDFSDDVKIEADFNVAVECANYSFNAKHVFKKADEYGEKCCTMEELFNPENGFIIDGGLTIKMEGILMIEKDMPKKTDDFGDHRDALCLGLWEQNNKDFTVVADGKEITAHKWVLTLRSPVFAKMFQSGMKEAKENKVVIKDFSFDIVEKAIKLCYHQSLVGATTLEDKMQLLQFFDKYEIQQLKNDLEIYLISLTDVVTVCRLTNAALISNARKLEGKCAEFLRECFLQRNPICDFDLLDKDFAMNFLKTSFYPVSK